MEGNDVKLSIGVIVGSFALIVVIVLLAQVFDKPDQIPVNDSIGESLNVKGDPDADITIVEFSDFGCPACSAAVPPLDQFMQDYSGQVRFYYRHFPLPQHPNANEAAFAAEAAAEQEQFWPVHDWLFDNQTKWSEAEVSGEYFYEQFGEDLKLEKDKFLADYISEDVRKRVLTDRSDAVNLGVNSTPSLFINGEKTAGVKSYEQLVKLTGVVENSPTVEELPPNDKPEEEMDDENSEEPVEEPTEVPEDE